jgi:hypothetical protein
MDVSRITLALGRLLGEQDIARTGPHVDEGGCRAPGRLLVPTTLTGTLRQRKRLP